MKKLKLLAALCFVQIGLGQPSPGAMNQANSDRTDTRFAKRAASSCLAEGKLGQLAQEKGLNPSVKSFGKRMETDCTKVNDQLSATASRDNISLPTDVSPKDQTAYDTLSSLSGLEFDEAYAKKMVTDNQNDVAEFNREITDGQNPDMKAFASQALPALQNHFKLAQEVEAYVKSKAKRDGVQ